MARATTHLQSELEVAFDQAAAGERVTIRRGDRAVVLLSLEDFGALEELEREEDAMLAARAAEAEAESRASGAPSVSLAELKRELGLD